MSRLPTNAKQIIAARMQGFRPAEIVMVSLIGRISQREHTVHADPRIRYDWRWVRGLDLCIWINPQCDWRGITLEIKKARPRYVWIWDVASQRGASVYLRPSHPASEDKPFDKWEWILDFSSWWECQNEQFMKDSYPCS